MGSRFFNIAHFKTFRSEHLRRLNWGVTAFSFLNPTEYAITEKKLQSGSTVFSLVNLDTKKIQSLTVTSSGNVMLRKSLCFRNPFLYALAIRYGWLHIKSSKTPMTRWAKSQGYSVRRAMTKDGREIIQVYDRFGRGMDLPSSLFSTTIPIRGGPPKIRDKFMDFCKAHTHSNIRPTRRCLMGRYSISTLAKKHSVCRATVRRWLDKLEE